MSNLEDDPFDKAAQLGKVAVTPLDDELFIDVDDDGRAFSTGLLTAKSAGIHVVIDKQVPSKTPGHFHAYCRTPGTRLTPQLRIALQACLGSDRKRELLSLARVLQETQRPPTVFFESPSFMDDEIERKIRSMGPVIDGPTYEGVTMAFEDA